MSSSYIQQLFCRVFKKLLVVIFIILLFSIKIAFAENHQTIHKLIPHIDQADKKVELYILKPIIEAKLPVVIYIHGFQHPERPGAKASINNGTLVSFANQGYLAVGVSQPGFGNSDGPADFSGPYTQRAIISAIKYLQSSEFLDRIDHNKIVLGGVSRGAITASMVATQEPNLAGLILDAGLYDIKATSYPKTLSNIEKEVGNNLTIEQIKQRSAFYHANNIKIPVIIFHGNQDYRHPMNQALKFYEALMKAGTKTTLILFPSEHRTPQESKELMINLFLKNLFISKEP